MGRHPHNVNSSIWRLETPIRLHALEQICVHANPSFVQWVKMCECGLLNPANPINHQHKSGPAVLFPTAVRSKHTMNETRSEVGNGGECKGYIDEEIEIWPSFRGLPLVYVIA
ncbi:hypothetical protein GX48_05050 [Paracoccidioides brasiliensis]|nr:hypothetical protein GX48_05050 [Paracoccidioides brasiliensis]